MRKIHVDARAGKNFFWFHAGVLLAAVWLFGVDRLLHALPFPVPGCLTHDLLRLYCPFCGGTRCVKSMLLLRFGDAMRANLFVFLLVWLVLILDVIALVRLLKGKQRLVLLPAWGYVALAVLLALFTVLRNYLLIRCGFDPLGDLLPFWEK